ncbi:MAG: cob(I)yrinic acid a,c-diamide adenosyltransferase [Bacteroidetes bacterium]|nr:MAG: cob(I)yrinic acid a,c-diamide adenosyltransferase [Bacteroidota bacterium]RLD71060.1 MAG: cob(I)yrinic acid a,c-diamide adenosyltransferase [Bacteroidota bacterium]RLD93642.1 MAG: cob(I)yrinic acid a,c-diamide adenosyltransferase [Bacteroidota bacterium]RLE00473.1 MAG: cob(I)yrinic acid a,c-diamide adenosyltransferase [Bacteroidota bacterium]
MKKSGIYTKGGDKGKTSLIGGRRVPKFHARIEAYGTVDELMAHTTMLRDLVKDVQIRDDLLSILNIQMATASVLAADCDDCPLEIPVVGDEQVSFLEAKIDEMDASLEPLSSFLIPGGDLAVSQAHIARTVCRRTERCILKLAQDVNIQEDIIRFYNRLSDYFFVLSRKIAHLSGLKQEPWNPGL